MTWVKCSERMPAHEEEVVAYYKSIPMCLILIYCADQHIWWRRGSAPLDGECITHWMPLPPEDL